MYSTWLNSSIRPIDETLSCTTFVQEDVNAMEMKGYFTFSKAQGLVPFYYQIHLMLYTRDCLIPKIYQHQQKYRNWDFIPKYFKTPG